LENLLYLFLIFVNLFVFPVPILKTAQKNSGTDKNIANLPQDYREQTLTNQNTLCGKQNLSTAQFPADKGGRCLVMF